MAQLPSSVITLEHERDLAEYSLNNQPGLFFVKESAEDGDPPEFCEICEQYLARRTPYYKIDEGDVIGAVFALCEECFRRAVPDWR